MTSEIVWVLLISFKVIKANKDISFKANSWPESLQKDMLLGWSMNTVGSLFFLIFIVLSVSVPNE